jgi:hypothetical protein
MIGGVGEDWRSWMEEGDVLGEEWVISPVDEEMAGVG